MSGPARCSRQDLWHDSISYSYPPLTFAVTTDPVSGARDGILKRPATDPLVFQIDSANEFWQMNASLNVADGAGRPVEVPGTVRLYFASSFQHGGGAGLLNPPGPVGMCQLPTQGNSWAPTLRALLAPLATITGWALRAAGRRGGSFGPPVAQWAFHAVGGAGCVGPRLGCVVW